MLRRLHKHLSFANVTALAALFIALGGTSYALTLPRNSVGANQIRTDAVRSAEVKDRSLRLRDLTLATRLALRGERGPAGPAGPAGGTPGTGTSTLVFTYKTQGGIAPAGTEQDPSTATATAQCDAGQRVTGGGVQLGSIATSIIDNHPTAAGTGWTARVQHDSSPSQAFTVYAVCTSGTS